MNHRACNFEVKYCVEIFKSPLVDCPYITSVYVVRYLLDAVVPDFGKRLTKRFSPFW